MASKDLIFRFIGIDAGAGAEMERLGGKLDTTGSKWKSYALGAGVAVAGLAAGAVHLADEWEQAHTRLEGAIQNVGGNMDALKGQVSSLDGQMAKFGFTATDTESSLAPLVTAVKNPTEAMHLMGLAADIARGRNISLSQATATLVKVETGHVSLLGRMGIATKDAQGHTISLSQAIQRLNQLYGGDAQRFAGTFSGKLQALSAQAQNLGISIGNALIPALTDVISIIERVGGAIGGVIHWFEQHETVAAALAGVLVGALTPALLDLAVAMGESLVASIGRAVTQLYVFVAGAGEARSASLAFVGSLGPIGLALAAVGAVAGVLWARQSKGAQEAKQAVDDFVASLHTDTNSVASLTSGLTQLEGKYGDLLLAHHQLEQQGSHAIAGAIGGSEAFKQMQAYGREITTVKNNTAAMAREFGISRSQVVALANANGVQLTGSLQTVRGQFSSLVKQAAATHHPLSAAASALRQVGSAGQTVTQDIQQLDTAWAGFIGNFIGSKAAIAQAKDAIVTLGQTLKKSHGQLSQASAAGRASIEQLASTSDSVKSAIDAVYNRTGHWTRGSIQQVRSLVNAMVSQLPKGSTAARKMADDANRYMQHLAQQAPAAGQKTGAGFARGIGSQTGQAGANAARLVGAARSHLANTGNVQSLGASLAQGYAQGIANGVSGVINAAVGLVAAALGAIAGHKGQNSNSPAKKFIPLGEDATAGYAVGVTNAKSKHVVSLAGSHVAQLLFKGLADGWKGRSSDLENALTTPLQNALNHMQTIVNNAIDKQKQALKDARSQLRSDLQSRRSDIQSMKGTLAGGDLSGLFGQDANGNPTVGNVGSFLQGQVGPLQRFAQDLKWARRHHLSPILLQQIAQLGAQQGDQILRQFMDGQASIGAANRAENQIQRLAGSAAQSAVDPSYVRRLREDRRDVKDQVHTLHRIEHHLANLERREARAVSHHITIEHKGGQLKVKNLSHQDGVELLKLLHKMERQGVR